MKAYRIKLLLRLITAIFYEVVGLLYVYRIYVPIIAREIQLLIGWPPFFQYVLPFSLLCLITVYSLYVIVDSSIALLNEQSLKEHFIKDTDERLVSIKEKSGTKLFRIIFLFETLIAFSFGHENPIVFGLLILNMFVLLGIYGGFRLNYWICSR
jgi:hypothetical protein